MRSVTTTIEVAASARYTYLDLTEDLERAIKDSGVTEGAAIAFCAHTTCALLINEWEEGALEDLRNRMIHLVPDDVYYAHDDLARRTQNLDESHERRNGPAHVKAMVLSASSHAIPVSAGEPILGRWQRLILFELDEPKDRQVVFHVFGE
ncbi:MAG TPA: secondary thiamine-phosphate synthase enzyme YjbQ [Actinomycetota bacterium]|nr:secondary thiamine-phosphate synthase enzyme YjbQ [Actinomycetota bacterium]